jgi:hypothetical protein
MIAGVRKTFAERSARVTTDASALPASSSHGSGIAKILGNGSDVTTTVSTQRDGKPLHYTVETRVLGDTLYVKVPPERAAAYGNPKTPWITANVRARADAYVGLGNVIPVEVVLALSTTAELAQRSPRRYTGVVNLTNAVASLPADIRAALTQSYGAINVAALTNTYGFTPNISVGVAADGRVTDVAIFTDGGARSTRVGFSDFGIDVSVLAPPAADVSPANLAGRPA